MLFRLIGRSIVIINDARTATDLLEKRADVYSDRPRFTVVGELMGLDRVRLRLHFHVRSRMKD